MTQLFVDQLCNIDFSYFHPERGLLGETWLADILLDGPLDEQGMVCDFSIVKQKTKEWLNGTLDHSLLVPALSPAITIEEFGEALEVHFIADNGDGYHCAAPRDAITLVQTEVLNEESVAQWAQEQLRACFPDSVERIELTFKPETIDGPYYHYSHGLKMHGGDCQRIAHGHRSRIEIEHDGVKAPDIEVEWAEKWHDIYIGTRDDLMALTMRGEKSYYRFAYEAEQGEFMLELPAKQCYLVAETSTVEFIAQHIADSLKEEYPEHSWRVKAYEGVCKGAIAEA